MTSSAPGPLAPLYPFLYDAGSSVDIVADAEESVVTKAREIIELRERVLLEQADALRSCAADIGARLAQGGRVLTFGNGGSSTDALALAYLFTAPPADAVPVPALCITTDVATLTALSNDVDFEVAIARQLTVIARPSDIAIALSTSGGSRNVLYALDAARAAGLLTVGFAGYDGGRMGEDARIDHLFVVPSSSVHRIQEAQTTLYHVLWELVQGLLRA